MKKKVVSITVGVHYLSQLALYGVTIGRRYVYGAGYKERNYPLDKANYKDGE